MQLNLENHQNIEYQNQHCKHHHKTKTNTKIISLRTKRRQIQTSKSIIQASPKNQDKHQDQQFKPQKKTKMNTKINSLNVNLKLNEQDHMKLKI